MNKKLIVVGSGKLTVKIAEYLKNKNLDVYLYEHKISNCSLVKILYPKKIYH